MTSSLELGSVESERATQQMKIAIDGLPASERPAQRVKFLGMLLENPGRLFVTKLVLSGAGPTYEIDRATLHPSQFYLNAITAVRAGKLDWDIE